MAIPLEPPHIEREARLREIADELASNLLATDAAARLEFRLLLRIAFREGMRLEQSGRVVTYARNLEPGESLTL